MAHKFESIKLQLIFNEEATEIYKQGLDDFEFESEPQKLFYEDAFEKLRDIFDLYKVKVTNAEEEVEYFISGLNITLTEKQKKDQKGPQNALYLRLADDRNMGDFILSLNSIRGVRSIIEEMNLKGPSGFTRMRYPQF